MSAINNEEEQQQLELPPGFRFHPTDEEVVSHYLIPKVLNCLFTCLVIADVDLNKCEPWDLPSKAKMGEKEWYFFCHKDRKYPTGMRTNRATATGYWKATGKDREIFRGQDVLVGMKKTLVFYLGRAPRGEKTPWVMHEYRLEGKLPRNLSCTAKDEWAVCRVFNKDLAAKPGQPTPSSSPAGAGMDRSDSLAFLEELLDLPDLTDSPVADDDFKSAAAGTSSGYHQVKTENPAPLHVQDHYSYFSLPPVPVATNIIPQAADHLSAIRRHCKAEASTSAADMGVGSSRLPLYPELFDDLCPDGFTDYSNMLKF